MSYRSLQRRFDLDDDYLEDLKEDIPFAYPQVAVAQLGATSGRQFSYELLRAVSPLDDTVLQHELRQLVEAELVYQQGVPPPRATYMFKHALIQEAAYQSLLKSTRQQVHQRMAQTLKEQFPETAVTQPELLAHHYTEAGLADQGVPYWQRAGERAIEHSAHAEATAHLSRGLKILMTLPDTPERVQRELDFQIALRTSLTVTKGWPAPEAGAAYSRAWELCQQAGETPQAFPVLWGLWHFHAVRAELFRLQGELRREEAEEDLLQSLDVARGQQVKSLELRTALSLSRLWQQQGKRHAAQELLAGERVLAPLRTFGEPLIDLIRPTSYTAHQGMFDASVPHGLRYYWKSEYLGELNDAAIDTLVAHAWQMPSPTSYTIIFQLGGAIRQVEDDASAFEDRHAHHALNINGVWSDPLATEEHVQWTRSFWEAIRAFSTGGVYMNFLGDEGEDRVKAAYGAVKYERLVALKNTYDPTNLFRLNQNIKPLL